MARAWDADPGSLKEEKKSYALLQVGYLRALLGDGLPDYVYPTLTLREHKERLNPRLK